MGRKNRSAERKVSQTLRNGSSGAEPRQVPGELQQEAAVGRGTSASGGHWRTTSI